MMVDKVGYVNYENDKNFKLLNTTPLKFEQIKSIGVKIVKLA